MCFYTTLKKDAETLKKRFDALVDNEKLLNNLHNETINGFSNPLIPIIANNNKSLITFGKWGLLPIWANGSFNTNTLNAKIETIQEKPSFSPYVNNRCLVIADGFFEWKWLDIKGKRKEKYYITLPHQEVFAFAGIYAPLTQSDGTTINTVSILTTQANEFMANIHNTKKRMPIILVPNEEKQWLNGINMENFKNCNPQLIAQIEESNGQQYLF